MAFNQQITKFHAFAPKPRRSAVFGPLRLTVLGGLACVLAGCAQDMAQTTATTAPPVGIAAATPVVNPVVAAPPPPPTARTADQFDTTTAEQRSAAVARPAAASAERLGTTIASLGPPAQAGLWMTTGLVSETTMGRVEYPANGKSVALELRPSGGAASAGSQISLAALRLLGAPLTGLPEVVVYRD